MKIKLANIIINIESLHNDVLELCKDYKVSEGESCFSVKTDEASIDYEREASGETGYIFSDGYLETLAVYRQIAEQLIEYDTILFHGSAIAINGKAYILGAPSGTGKSTLARNLEKTANELGEKFEYINDDKPLISVKNGEILVHGTPWDGKHHLSNNKSVPLAGICIIERSAESWIKEVSPVEIVTELLQQTYRPENPALLAKTLEVLNNICESIGCYRVGTTLDARTAQLFLQKFEEKANSTSIEEELEKNGWIAYTNVGSSMKPLIVQDRDLMIIEKRPVELHRNDVVLFKRTDPKQLVLHRIIKVHNKKDNTPSYDIIGDNQYGIEKGVKDEQIIGILTKVIKDANTSNSFEIEPDDSKYFEPRSRIEIMFQRFWKKIF